MTWQRAGTKLDYTVTFLEMDARPTWQWPHLPMGAQVSLMHAEKPPVWFFLSLYDAVGRDYAWEDIHKREHADIQEWLAADTMSLFVLYGQGWPQGFFLLEDKGEGVVDIAYLALVPEAIWRLFLICIVWCWLFL